MASKLDENGNPVDNSGQTTDPSRVRAAFIKYLGRDLSNPGEATGWLNDPNYEQDIAGSAEGQAYARRGSTSDSSNTTAQATNTADTAPAPTTPTATAFTPTTSTATPIPAPTTSVPTPESIRAAYIKYLGRDLSNPGEATGWLTDPNFEQDIAGSAEGQAYSTRGAGTSAISGSVTSPFQSTLNPNVKESFATGAAPADVAQKISAFIQSSGLQASQTDPASLTAIVNNLRSQGIDAQMAGYDSNGHNAGIVIGGKTYQLINGSNQWTPLQPFIDNSSDMPKPAVWTSAPDIPNAPGPIIVDKAPAPTTPAPTTPTPDPTKDVGAATQAAILKQLATLQTPTDPNSATVHAITDPYKIESQRGLEATRRALAEQGYANGNLDTGGYQQSQISAVEHAGANEANFTGQTVATQEAQRQTMLMNMLGLGQNASQFDKTLSTTQKNFADQLAQQDKQFSATLAANIKQFGETIGYQYALLDWSKTQAGINGSTSPVTV